MSIKQLDVNPRFISLLSNARIQTVNKLLIYSNLELQKRTGLNEEQVREILKSAAQLVLSTGRNTALDILRKKDGTHSYRTTKLKTGCEEIDKILHGGILHPSVTEICGESSSGKTQLCLQLCLTITLQHFQTPQNAGCLYLCTDDAFPTKRFQQLASKFCKRYSSEAVRWTPFEVTSEIFIEHAFDIDEMLLLLETRLPALLTRRNIKLLVIDSITALFRVSFESWEIPARAKCLSKVGSLLHKICKKYNCCIVCVNQVSSVIGHSIAVPFSNAIEKKVIPSLGLIWSYYVTTRLMLTRTQFTLSMFNNHSSEKETPGNYGYDAVIRCCEVLFAPHLPLSNCHFIVTKDGVENFVLENLKYLHNYPQSTVFNEVTMIKCQSVYMVTSFGKKYLSAHPDSTHSVDYQNESWLVVLNESKSKKEYEEIYWKGGTVVVGCLDAFYNEYLLKNCFTVESEVRDVMYTNFYMNEKFSEGIRCLCILEKDCVNFYTDVGELFVASLPFKVKKMWPLENGLCVEREATSSVPDEEKGMPTLFSLTHPLEDFKPVVYHYIDNRKTMYFTDSTQCIVFTCPQRRIIMTYDSVLGLHSIWKARKALEQDFPEVVSHQDSLPEFLGFMNQSSNILNLKDQSRLSMSPCASTKRHSCPPVPMHLQRRNSPANVGSPINKAYSPIVHVHKNSPNHGHDASYIDLNTSWRTHVSSSPVLFRMSCADTKLEEEPEPLPPNVCLEQIWQEQGNMIRYGLKGKAEKAFESKDFYDNEYIGYHMKTLSKLRVLKGYISKSNLTYEKAMEIDCLDAGPLKNCKMYVVLDLSQIINLYSGKQKIMKVQMPDEFSGNDLCVERYTLTCFAGDGFCVKKTSEGEKTFRMQIPTLCNSNIVLTCILSLRKVLAENDYILVHSKYYSMFHDGQACEKTLGEWEMFMKASLKLLGFPESSMKSLKENMCSPAPPEPKKAKKSDSFSGLEDWEYLLMSKRNEYLDVDALKSDKKFVVEIGFQTNAPLFQHFTTVFQIWNQLYEEFKLSTIKAVNLFNFAKFLHYLSKVFSSSPHAICYETDYPEIKAKQDIFYRLREDHENIFNALHSSADGSVLTYITHLMKGIHSEICFKNYSGKAFKVVVKVLGAIIKHADKKERKTEEMLSQLKLSRKEVLVDLMINIMLKENFTRNDLEKLPIGFKLPIKEILHFHREFYTSVAMETAGFLGREDIIALKESEAEKKTKTQNQNSVMTIDESDGMALNEEILKFRFNEDLRMIEVKRLLNSSVPVNVVIEQKPDVNDHAFAKEEEAKLLLLSKRTMSVPVGRGMFTLGTSQPNASKAVSIPALNLCGRSNTTNKNIQISQAEISTTRLLWPSFHNGVAAGLKIAPGSLQVDSTWILFNKLKCSNLDASHSGFLFALGLMGHISALPKLHLHDYLIKGHDLTTVALLLGMSVTQIGSKNTDTYKLLCLHLDSLLPPTALELNIPKTSQIASLISLGFLFFQTCDMHLVKVLLQEIGRSPGPEMENSTDRESHALSAGLALGMVMIGHGTDKTTIPDINVLDLLFHYMSGGQKKDTHSDVSEKRASCQIHEGDMVNTNVTAPAATIAIALMYLNTNNSSIANMLKVPTKEKITHTIKPDDALFRMLSYNLIMWNNLVPTEAWLESFVAEYKQLLEMKDVVSIDEILNNFDNSILNYRLCMVTGCLLALAIKFAGSCNLSAFNLTFPWIKVIRSVAENVSCEEVGSRNVLEQCLNTILISLSLLMAGSGNIEVLRVARQLYKRCSHEVSYGSHMSVNMAVGFLFLGGGRYTLKTDTVAVASLLCAVYPKWPVSCKDNRFHLQALRHLYVLACESRLFITRDVDTKAICYTPIAITMRENKDYPETECKLLSPCFIPESKFIKKVVTIGPRYWCVTLHTNNNKSNKWWLEQIQNVFVKKKGGYLSYTEDPKGFRNLLGRTFTNQFEKLECVKAFNSSPQVVLFDEMFCKTNKSTVKIEDESNSNFFSNVLCQCIRQEKLDVLNDYMAIEKIIRDVEHDIISVCELQQLVLLFRYYSCVHSKLRKSKCVGKESLINSTYLIQCRFRLEKHINIVEGRDFEADKPLHFWYLKCLVED